MNGRKETDHCHPSVSNFLFPCKVKWIENFIHYNTPGINWPVNVYETNAKKQPIKAAAPFAFSASLKL